MSIFEKNKGTPTDPFEIWTEDDLRELIDYNDIANSNLAIEFKSDIEMERDWTSPISKSTSTAFKGIIDGNGFTIKNLNSPNGSPLIHYIDQGTVKNLTISSIKFNTDTSNVSPFLGRTYSSYASSARFANVINCVVEDVEIDITDSSTGGVGGILGWAYRTSINISNSYVKDIRITRGRDTASGSGAIVGYTQGRIVNLDNVFAFGEVSIYDTTATNRGWQSSLTGTVEGATINGHVIQATTYSTHNSVSSHRIDTPLVKDSYSNLVTFGPNQPWDMVDGELPYLTYLGTYRNPHKISVKEDLSLIDELLYDSFELVNDIEVNTRYDTYVFENRFYGTIDGNGYGLYGIDMNKNSSSGYLALFYEFYGYMKDIIIEMDRVYVGTSSGSQTGRVSALAYNFGGKIRDVRVSVGTLRGGATNNGLLGHIIEGADVKNCFLYVGTLGIYISTASILGGLSKSTSGNRLDVTIENNIFHINRISASNANFVASTNKNIKNNVLYVGEGRVDTHTGQQIRVSSLRELRDPDNSAYDSFDKDKWVFRDGEDPIQSVFIKITEKIEERLISLYSKGMYLESRWTKGFKNILNFFTNKSGSSTRTKRSPFRRLLSFTKDISLKMLFKKRGRKRVKSNSGLVVSNITKLKKLTETILSYSNKITSNYIKVKSGAKILEIYSDKVSFRTIEIKKSLKNAVNYSKGIRDNLLKKITRRHNRKTQSFSRDISSDVLHSYLTRVTERVMSYSGHMRSIIRRASNKYDFEYRMVSNQANKITIRFRRFIRTMRTTRSHSGIMTTFVRRLSRISAPTEIFARTIARTNSIRMRVKESFTKIRASNGGGD